MGLSRFNQSSSSSNGALLYRMKPVPITTQLYGQGVSGSNFNIPVVRSGAGDKSFAATDSAGVNLYTTNSAGVSTATATITYTTYLASSVLVSAHLNSPDQCLYVLVYASPSWRFIKINDSTGVVTTIGSSFTPATPTNWPLAGSTGLATMEVDSVSGHLKVVFNGVYHLINKSTGAIVSQDTAITLGSFLARRVFYATQDSTVGISNDVVTALTGAYSLPSTVHSTYGHITSYPLAIALVGNLGFGDSTAAPLNSTQIILCDTDKVFLASLVGGSQRGVKLFLRTDFDKFIKSIAELGAGVI